MWLTECIKTHKDTQCTKKQHFEHVALKVVLTCACVKCICVAISDWYRVSKVTTTYTAVVWAGTPYDSCYRMSLYLLLHRTKWKVSSNEMEKEIFFFFSYACHEPWLVSQETASSSVECRRDKPPFSFARGQDSTAWDIVWVSPQGHRSVSKSPFPSAGTAVSLFRAEMVQ